MHTLNSMPILGLCQFFLVDVCRLISRTNCYIQQGEDSQMWYIWLSVCVCVCVVKKMAQKVVGWSGWHFLGWYCSRQEQSDWLWLTVIWIIVQIWNLNCWEDISESCGWNSMTFDDLSAETKRTQGSVCDVDPRCRLIPITVLGAVISVLILVLIFKDLLRTNVVLFAECDLVLVKSLFVWLTKCNISLQLCIICSCNDVDWIFFT